MWKIHDVEGQEYLRSLSWNYLGYCWIVRLLGKRAIEEIDICWRYSRELADETLTLGQKAITKSLQQALSGFINKLEGHICIHLLYMCITNFWNKTNFKRLISFRNFLLLHIFLKYKNRVIIMMGSFEFFNVELVLIIYSLEWLKVW